MTGTCCCVISLILAFFLHNAAATEVTDTVWVREDSLDIDIRLPVLACHSKIVGYREVRWYKDYALVKSGSNHPFDHSLSLSDLLDATSGATVYFDNPLKLQGYYWCETDRMNGSALHSYLFRMREVHTYVGKLVATKDSMGDDFELSLKDKITLKKLTYEEEMQEVLFGFLPKPNTYVTDVRDIEKGLEVRFYVYSRQLFHPRVPHADELIADKHELESIMESFSNETEVADVDLHQQMVAWTDMRGIDIEKIELRSTLGCYEEVSLVSVEPPRAVTWPYAEIGEVVIPRDVCSSKNGLAVTRLCAGSFYTGPRWGYPSGTCDKPPNKLTAQLRNLYGSFGDSAKPAYIEQLQQLTNRSEMLTVTDLHIVADILTELSEVSDLKLNDMDGIFSVIDRLVETNRSELQAAKSTIKLTSRLLRIISNLLRTASLEQREVLIEKQHLLVDAKGTREEDDRVIGLAISAPSSSTGPSVRLLLEGGPSAHPAVEDTLAYFLLPPELVAGREKETAAEIQTQVSVVFFRDWVLFPNPKGVLVRRNYKVLPSSVMLVSVTGGPAWNLSNPAQLYFRDENGKKIENPVCVQFDPKMEDGEGAWSTEGCEYDGIKDGFHSCLCHHLSIFAVVLSERPDIESVQKYGLGTAVYVGCVASILALSFTFVLYLLSKVWRQTVDQSILFWLSVALLCFIFLLLLGDMKRLAGCRVVAVLMHYSLLVAAGWLLVQALMHRLRFANKTDMQEVPHFILKAGICCWGSPIIIMLIIWFTKDYNYKQDSCRRAMCDLSRWTLIPIIMYFVITMWLNLCAVYAVTCRFKKDYLIGNLGYDESVIKFRVALTIYFFVVMSYLFGFFALHKRSRELRILFSISITLTSYYLTLFFVFQEVSLWEMWAKWKKQRNDKSAGETVKFSAGKEKYTEEPGNTNPQSIS